MSIEGGPAAQIDSGWQSAVIYQIYPRSFHEVRDEQADLRGEGSLQGIISKLDYLQDLGINAVWLSPFYPSPMKDGGYDVADYTDVDARYGALTDFTELTTQAHERGIKIMVDLIPNHTSDQHPWFQESRSSRDNPKNDWYTWRNPSSQATHPNNWASVFSMSQLEARKSEELIVPAADPTPPIPAWTYDKARGQYYLHSFAKEQPDLNWQKPEVREAIKNVMHFWIEHGVDGFRVDAVNYIGKDPKLSDEEPSKSYQEGVDNPYDQLERCHSTGYPPTFYPYLREMVSVLEAYPDKDLRLIFEAYMPENDLQHINELAPRHASAFNFTRLEAPWQAHIQAEILTRYHATLPEGAIPNQVNGNHDKSRLATRISPLAARTAAVINLTLPGMPFIYNGEEGGFTDVNVSDELQDDKLGGRDPERTPMLWTSGKNAGFSEADKLWLPLDSGFASINLERQGYDPHSSLNLYKTLLAIRNGSRIIQGSNYVPLFADDQDVLVYARRLGRNQVIVAANFSERHVAPRIWRAQQVVSRIILSSLRNSDKSLSLDDDVVLLPNESVILIPNA